VKVIERAERQGRHPQTNEVVTFPPVKSINCRLSESIKDAINGR
jgi:Bacterial DNA-binding protein.